MKTPQYDAQFFDDITDKSVASARIVAPIVMDLIDVRSVVDIGCGRGAWLKAFADLGVADINGYDGDYVARNELLIAEPSFTPFDLSHPLNIGRRFDLAVCLEVAEHLPAERGAGLIGELTQLSDVILFSAAVPGQRGYGHINEQWPAYWQRLFEARQYELVDWIRPRIMGLPQVAWWFRQNLMLFASPQALKAQPKLAAARDASKGFAWEWVHRELTQMPPSVRSLLSELPAAVGRSLRHRAEGWRRRLGLNS